MNILVTAGNTQTPVDRVRCITNVFSGRTGAGIAARAFDRGHSVAFLTSHPEVLAELPPARPRGEPGFRVRPYRTFDDLDAAMREEITSGAFHAVIHATMEISFSTNLLAYAMFVDWAAGPSRSRLDGVWSGLAVLSRARGWQILAAGIVASLLYGAVADPMLARLRPIVDIDRVRFSLAMLAAVGVVVFAAGRAIVERRARDGTEAPTGLDRHPLVLFDGVCGMCNRTRRFRARARPGRPVSLRRPAVGGRAGGAGAASAAARLQRLHGADRGRAMPSLLDRRARDRAAARSALVDPVGARVGTRASDTDRPPRLEARERHDCR